MLCAVACHIRITSGDDAGRVIEVRDEVLLGRRQPEPGKIRDLEASRVHARVFVDPVSGLTIEDANSTNGTFVGGERIVGPRPLNPGDAIRLGQTTLEVVATPAGEPETEPEPPREEPSGLAAAPPPLGAPVEGPYVGEAPVAEEPVEEDPVAEEPVEEDPVAEEPLGDDTIAAGSVVEEPAPPEPHEEAVAEAPAVEEEPAVAARPAGGGVPRPLVYVLLGVLLLAAAGIAAVVYFTGEDDGESGPPPRVQGPPALVSAATQAGCVARDLEPEGNRIVANEIQVRYRSNPPHSGDHWKKPASDGIWETAPPLPKIVRSLHMGRIVMWHKPGDEKAYRILREVGDESAKHMLLVPNKTMPHRVAVTAWGRLLGCPGISGSTAPAVRAFRDAYRDKGPEFEP